MSKESVLKAAPSIPAINILPPQITKLKKEEEEETWISGEELYTEGSSDEENFRCKSRLMDQLSKESSLSLVARPRRSKAKLDKKLPRAMHSRSTSAEDSDNALHQSTSKGHHHSPRSIACTDAEEEYVADDEISWKANRDELQLGDEIFALQEYPKICESMDSIFRDFIERLNCLEKVENENCCRQEENLQNELKNNVMFLDAAVDKLESEIECVKRKTKQVQLQNRLRLNEIKKRGPKFKKLDENTKRFIELYGHKIESSDFKDRSSERSEVSDRSESIQLLSDVTEDLVKLLDESTVSEGVTTNIDYRSSASNN
ncbi:uncharacterized protein LOC116738458 [Nasonia vitripennis]|uniref:Uncharacterized protein n=1 Tax=Nasonia vitripennis TaxID=7425 RepID=A0A7M7GFF3_NASVI|nr:uncharacterized protein LOC116738458 [Nasonia vitripennis]